MERHKPFNIDQAEVMDAYKKVKANKGAAGVDQQSIKGLLTRSYC